MRLQKQARAAADALAEETLQQAKAKAAEAKAEKKRVAYWQAEGKL